MKPKIVTLCGSSRFCDVIAVCAWLIEQEEKAIAMGLHLLPFWYSTVPDHLAEHEEVASEMDALHLRKIDISDEIFVVNVENYIGQSTAREIEYAIEQKKDIRYYLTDPVGKLVSKIILDFADKSPDGGDE